MSLLACGLAPVALARDADPYKLLDLSRGAGDADIKRAHRKLSLKYHPDKQSGKTPEDVEKAQQRFMAIQRAYETLSDPERRRNYDSTGYADPKDAYKEQQHASAGKNSGRGRGPHVRPGDRGGWDSGAAGGRHGGPGPGGYHQPDPITSDTLDLKPGNFAKYVLDGNRAWLVQVYHDGSERCHRAAPAWEQTSRALDGIAKLGRINLAHYPALAAQVAPKHLFSATHADYKDLPVVVGFAPGCKKTWCKRKYRGVMKENALSAFAMDRLLLYADVPLHTRDTLPSFLESEPEKVKFVMFSSRSSTPPALLRRAATEYEDDVSFARVIHASADASYWIKKFNVVAPPAVLVMKEGNARVVEHEVSGKDKLKALLIEHKLQTLPQLRVSNVKSVGCQPGGLVQTCVVLLGVRGLDAFERARSTLRDAKASLQSTTEDFATLSTALEAKELAFAWVDAKTQASFCRAFFAPSDAASAAACGKANAKPRVFAMRFTHGPDVIEHAVYDGEMDARAILSWVAKTSDAEGGSLREANRGDARFPELTAPKPSAIESLREWKTDATATAYDLAEELMYICVESGPVAPMFLLIVGLLVPSFVRRPKKSKRVKKKREVDDDAVVDWSDDDTLASLKGSQSGMVVVMLVDGFKTDQEVFKRLRGSFWREPILSFGTVNIAKVHAWAEFAETNGAAASTIVIWHPSRTKYRIIGNGETPHPELCSKIEQFLDGISGDLWVEGNWPSTSNN